MWKGRTWLGEVEKGKERVKGAWKGRKKYNMKEEEWKGSREGQWNEGAGYGVEEVMLRGSKGGGDREREVKG